MATSSQIPPSGAGLQPSLVIPQTGLFSSIVGWNPQPAPTISPFISQPANRPLIAGLHEQPAFHSILARSSSSSPVFLDRISGDTDPMFNLPEGRLNRAFADAAKGNVESAGENFRGAREMLQIDFVRGNSAEQFIAAAMGEALWFKGADEATYHALDLVNEWAGRSGAAGIEFQERLVRANLIRRSGGSYETSLELLVSVAVRGNFDDPVERGLMLQSRVSQIDMYLQCGIEDRKGRAEMFANAVRVLDELDAFVHEAGEMDSVLNSFVAELHAHMIELFMKFNFSVTAYRVAKRLAERYGTTEAARRMLSRQGPIGIFVAENGELEPDEFTGGQDDEPLKGIRAAVRELVANARFDCQSEFWKAATLGAGLGIIGAAAFFGVDFHTLLAGSGIGAAGLVTAGKLYAGITAEETRQALATGHSNHRLAGNALARVAEIGATYAFFGGPMPGVGYLADVPGLEYLVAHSDGVVGQFHGLGSAMSGLGAALFSQGGEAVRFVREQGLAGGLDAFWSQYSRTTVLGSALQAGADFWRGFASYAANELPQAALRGISSMASDPVSVETALRAYKAAAVGWAGATMLRPELRDGFYRSHPRVARAMELALMPAGYLFGVDVGLATGIAELDARIISAIGMASQLVTHEMSGGRMSDLDLANVIRNAAVPALYTGVGIHMQSSVPLETFSDYFANSMGIQVGFMPIGFMHGLMLKFPLLRFWQNKAGRSFSAETIGNIGQIWIGWASYGGVLFSSFMQMFVQCPWMTKVWQEPVGGTVQHAMFVDGAKPVAAESGEAGDKLVERKAEAAKRLEGQAKVAGRRWPFLTPLTGKTLIERIPMLTAYPFTKRGKDEPFPTIPEERYYRMIYRTLVATDGRQMDGEYVSQFLENLDIMAKDVSPGRRDVRRNLLLTAWAARGGVHGDAIRDFFKRHDWVFDHYGIDRNMEAPPDGGLRQRMKQARWFRERLSGSDGRG